MNEKDTYDFEGKGQLERIEWDDLWYQEADDPKARRMLLIGDSITRGMRPFANELAAAVGGVADQLATSKSMDHPLLTALVVALFLAVPYWKTIVLPKKKEV